MSIERFRAAMRERMEMEEFLQSIKGTYMYDAYFRRRMSFEEIKKEIERRKSFDEFLSRFTKTSLESRDMLIEWYENHPGIEPTHYYTYRFPFDDFRILKTSVDKPLPPAFGAESIKLIVPCGMEIPEQTEFTHNNEYHLCDGPIPHFRPWYSDM